MAIGRISGSVLKSNLTRNGVDLAFETNLLYLDVTNNRIGIGTSEPTTALHVNGTITASGMTGLSSLSINNTSTSDSLTITTTEDSSTAGPVLSLKRNSASPADTDYLGQINFNGENDADQEVNYAGITGKILDASDGTEDGIIEFSHIKAGSQVITGRWRSDSLQLLNGTHLTVAGDTTVTGSLTADGLAYPTSDGTANQVLATDGNGTLSFITVSLDSLNTGGILFDDNKITGQRSNENIEIEASGTGVIEVNSSIVPKTDLSISLGSPTKRFTDAYFGSGTVYIGDESISSSDAGLVFSAPISVEGGLTQISDDTTATVINATKIGNSATTVNSFDSTDYDSVLYYTTTLDESNNKIEVAKVSLCHNTATSYLATSGIATSDTDSVHTYSTDINSGTVRLSLFGSSAVNSMTAYQLGLGDNSTAGTSGHTAVVTPNTISGSSTTSIDSWSASTYRAVKYFVSVKNTDTNEVNSIEAIVLHNGSSADIVNYNIVKTGNEELCTLSAGYDSGTVHLYAVPNNSQTLRIRLHKIILSDSESVVNYDNVYVLPTKTISGSSYTTIDTFEDTKINGAVYFVTSTNTTDGLYTASEVYVTTDGTESFMVHGPELAIGGRIYFQTSLSGNKVNLKAHTTGSSNTVINAYRIGMYRFEQGGDFAQTVTLDTAQTITGAKTFSNAVVMMTNLPTSDPNNAGQLWNNSGVLNISAG
jgi:hypothetical protein